MLNNYLSTLILALAILSSNNKSAIAQESHQHHNHDVGKETTTAKTLPPVPANLPKWMNNKDTNHIYRQRGKYNDDIYNIRPLALDLNGV